LPGTTQGRYRVRWAAAGRERCKSFATRPLADAFAGSLRDAARHGQPFDPATGMPAEPKAAAAASTTWYEHSRAYAEMKWPALSPKSRRAAAEALTTLTMALTTSDAGQPPRRDVPRRALFGHAFKRRPARPPRSARHRGRPGLDGQSVAAIAGASRTSGRPRGAQRVRPADRRQARRRDHLPPQARRPVRRADRGRTGELDLGLDTGAPGGPLPIIASRMGVLLDALARAWRVLGLDAAAGGDEVFFQLAAARVIEPVSKLDSARVLEEAGVAPAPYRTVTRRLRAFAKDSFR
jgi:hypothetical protein